MSRVSEWRYRGQEITRKDQLLSFEPKMYGFVYMITLRNNQGIVEHQYIGKTALTVNRYRVATKKERGRYGTAYLTRRRWKGEWKYYKVVKKDLKWKEHIGDHKFLINNWEYFNVEREILAFGTSKKDLAFKEVKEIIKRDAIEDPKFLNKMLNFGIFTT